MADSKPALMDRRVARLWCRLMDLHWQRPSNSIGYVIVCDPATPERGHWDHDA